MSASISAAILDAVEEPHTPLAALVDAYSDALRALRSRDDVEARMRDCAELSLAAEAAGRAFAAMSDTARTVLAQAFEATGCPGIYTAHHHVTTRAGSRLVRITDAAALAAAHPDLMLPQPDKPDTAAIGALLRAGETVAGASLSNGGASVLSFRKNNQKG